MQIPKKRSALRRKINFLQLKLVEKIYQSPGKILLSVLAVSVVAAFYTFQLFQDVRTDFATLLPENDRSVVHAHEATARIGGTGNIFVSIYSPDFEANKKFIEAFAGELRKYPQDLIKFFEYRTNEAADFFKDYLFYYLTIQELKELRTALQKRFQKTRLGALGLDLEESNPDAELKKLLNRIFEKYKSQNPFGVNKDGYFTDATGQSLALIIRPAGDAADVGFSRKIIARINADIKKVNPTKFHSGMEVGLAGTYVALLENFSSIIQETIQTAGITIFLVLLSIWFFYRSVRMVAMMCAGILVGILVTFMLTYFKIGYLNQQTAFLASIIIGNGINFGLIHLARYVEERAKGVHLRRALFRGVFYTISATFMAAVATSISYGIMSVTTFKGFSQFGFIGGVGMLVCWLTLTLTLPCFIVFFERWRPQKEAKIRKFIETDRARIFSALVQRYRRALTYVMYAIVPVSIIFTAIYFSADRFEYDLKKLSLKTTEAKGTESYYNKRIDKILGNGNNPSMLLAHSRQDANKIGLELEKRIAAAAASGKPMFISTVRWLDQFYPQQQKEKFQVIRDLRKLFLPKYISFLAKDQRAMGRMALNALKANPFKIEEMPEMLLRNFRETDGTMGRIIYVTASQKAVLSNIKDVIQIGNEISHSVKLAPGKKIGEGEVLFASESMIFSDILRDVSREGPIVTLVCFLAVGAFIWLGFRRLREFLFIYLFLTFGLLSFIAALYLFGVKLNFFNFITIPITIGIGVDYAINLYYRYKVDGEHSIQDALSSTGSAVFLCSWTTIIGYGSMLGAKNQAMASFGLMAVIGEISCLVFAMIFMTAYLGRREDKRAKLRESATGSEIPQSAAQSSSRESTDKKVTPRSAQRKSKSIPKKATKKKINPPKKR
ncbi:MAG TPA: MMPL family transporter [Turneriella sp.]|nr:MMPL family transporter [Turneriella sp.]